MQAKDIFIMTERDQPVVCDQKVVGKKLKQVEASEMLGVSERRSDGWSGELRVKVMAGLFIGAAELRANRRSKNR